MECPNCGNQFSLTNENVESGQDRALKSIGHFDLVETVGVGAFGTVWKAIDRDLDRTVAIKIPRRGELTSSEQELFLREARAAAGLKHPGIVPVHEVGRDGDSLYIVSDFVRGIPLSEWLNTRQLSPTVAVKLIARLAEALAVAHREGVVHRDLKPANVIVEYNDHEELIPHLTDFGLARRQAIDVTMTVEGRILGTPAYMSPEQAVGKAHEADARSDIYSLGVMLFQLLTGELPFRGEIQMLIYQIINDDAPAPRTLRHTVSRDLETICLKCLEKNPDNRYDSATELQRELQRVLDNKPIHARPVGFIGKATRWCNRHRAITALIFTIAAVLMIGTVVSTSFAVQLHHQTIKTGEQAKAASKNAETARANEEVAIKERNAADDARLQALRERSRARHIAHAAHLNLASRAIGEGNIVEAHKWLQKDLAVQEDDIRSFSWHFLWGQCHSEKYVMSGHVAAPTVLAFSPCGKFLVSGGRDATLCIWNVETGELVRTLREHRDQITDLTFLSNTEFVSAAVDGKLIVWDVISGKSITTVAVDGVTDEQSGKQHPARIESIVIHGDSVACGLRSGIIDILSLTTGTSLHRDRVFTYKLEKLDFDASSGIFACLGSDADGKTWRRRVKGWTVAGLNEIRSDGPFTLTTAVTDRLPSVAARHFAIGSGTVQIDDSHWAIPAGDSTDRLNEAVEATHHRQDCRWYITAPAVDLSVEVSTSIHSPVIRLISEKPDTLIAPRVLRGHTSRINAVVISKGANAIASACEDGLIRLWDLDYIPVIKSLRKDGSAKVAILTTLMISASSPHSTYVNLPITKSAIFSPAFTPDGEVVLGESSPGRLGRWQTKNGMLIGEEMKRAWPINAIAASANSACEGTYWGKRVHLYPGEDATPVLGGAIRCITYLNQGSLLAIGHGDVLTSVENRRIKMNINFPGMVSIWDIQRSEITEEWRAHRGGIYEIGTSESLELLATAGGDGIRVWNTREWSQHEFSVDAGVAYRVSFHPTEALVAAVRLDSIQVWNVKTNELVASFEHSAEHWFGDAVFTPDGRLLIVATADGNVQCVDTETWEVQVKLHLRHVAPVSHLAASPCGRFLGAVSHHPGQFSLLRATGESAVRYEAMRLVDELLAKHRVQSEVIQKLTTMGLSSTERSAALRYARQRNANPTELNRSSRELYSTAGASREEYSKALRFAEEACRIRPNYAPFLCSLGAARYRVGDYSGAVRAIESAASAFTPEMVDLRTSPDARDRLMEKRTVADGWGYLAMARARQGNIPAAHNAFEKLIASWSKGEDDLIDEVEATPGIKLVMGEWDRAMELAAEAPLLLRKRAMLFARKQRFGDARQAAAKLLEIARSTTPPKPNLLYNAACAYGACAGVTRSSADTRSVRAEFVEMSLKCLKEAVAAGYNRFSPAYDSDLAVLRELPEFERITEGGPYNHN